jgi:hypothetical protein
VPVAPRKDWNLWRRRRPDINDSIASGWSPHGMKSDVSSNCAALDHVGPRVNPETDTLSGRKRGVGVGGTDRCGEEKGRRKG